MWIFATKIAEIENEKISGQINALALMKVFIGLPSQCTKFIEAALKVVFMHLNLFLVAVSSVKVIQIKIALSRLGNGLNVTLPITANFFFLFLV